MQADLCVSMLVYYSIHQTQVVDLYCEETIQCTNYDEKSDQSNKSVQNVTAKAIAIST